jgi:hypothetical protein
MAAFFSTTDPVAAGAAGGLGSPGLQVSQGRGWRLLAADQQQFVGPLLLVFQTLSTGRDRKKVNNR